MTPATTDATAVRSEWDRILDELEAWVDAAECVATSPGTTDAQGTWAPPVRIGPMPARLEARARALADRQDAVLAALAGACDRTQRQLSVIDHVRSTVEWASAPAYLDRAL